MAELTWGQVKTGGNGEGTPFLKLQPGVNQVRVVGLPYEVDIHWEDGSDGSKKRVICLGVGCPVCKAGHVPTKRYQVLVIDKTDSKVKILEAGSSIFKQIKDYAMDADYGDPSMYDFKIKKEGSGRETKYSVVASPNKGPLTAEETALVNASKSLIDINKPKSVDEIMQMGLAVFENSNSADEWNDKDDTIQIDNDDDWDSL